MLKILHVSPLDYTKGGHSRAHTDLALLLKKNGIESAFAVPYTDDLGDYMDDLGIQCYPIKTSSLPGLATMSFEWQIKKRLSQIIENYNPDIVLTETVGLGPTIESIKKVGGRKLRLIHWEKSPPTEASILGKLQYFHWRRTWKRYGSAPDCTMFQSKPHIGHVIDEAGISPKMSIVMENGVDVQLFDKDGSLMRDQNKICYVGTVSKARGVFDLIAAGDIVYKEKPDFQLHIFGHGSSKSAVRKLAEDRIWLKVHEFLEEQDFVRHLSEASIGVVPHPDYPVWRICSALKLREYAAMGMAVVARRLPVHEEFEGEDWMFIKEDGVGETSLAAGMISALQDIEKNGNSISSSSREYAERYFTYEYQTKALLNWIGI